MNEVFTALSRVNWDRWMRRIAIGASGLTLGYAAGNILGNAMKRTPKTLSSGH